MATLIIVLIYSHPYKTSDMAIKILFIIMLFLSTSIVTYLRLSKHPNRWLVKSRRVESA